jgi:hypothetical protein
MEPTKFENLKTLVLSLEADYYKSVNNKNKSAGLRLRKGMQDLKKLAQEVRLESFEKEKS